MRLAMVDRLVLFCSVVLCLPPTFGDTHLVKEGDTLYKIFAKKFGAVVYTQDSWVNEVLAMNPHIQNADLIFPGQLINLDISSFGTTRDSTFNPTRGLAQVKVPEKNEALAESQIKTEMGFEYFRLNSTDRLTGAKSVFLSNLSPQAKLTWDLLWDDAWTVRMQASYLAQEILPDDALSTVTLDKAKSPRYGFLVGAERSWNDWNRTGLFVNYRERTFAHATAVNRLSIDRIGTPAVQLSHEFDIFSKKGMNLGVNFSGQYLLGASGPGYSTKSGYSGDAHLYLKHQLKNFTLSGSVYYGIVEQDSDLVTQDEIHLGYFMGITWHFKD